MKFSNTNHIIFITICLLVFLSCVGRTLKHDSELVNPEVSEIDSTFSLKKDSLYKELIKKVNNDSIYVPVVRFIIDKLNPVDTHFNDTLFLDYFSNEYFF